MKKLLCCLTVLLLTGCSAQLGYRYADTLVEWQLDDYVELTDDQQQRVSVTIDELHLWHAQQELPKYRTALAELREKIAAKQLQYDDIDRTENQLWQFWANVQNRLLDEVALLQDLSMAQRRELLNNLQDKIDEQREEQAEDNESPLLAQIDRVNRREERLKEWTGDVTDEQQVLIRKWVRERPEGEFWLDYRQRWHDAFADALLQQPPDMAALQALITEPRALRSAAHKAYTEQRTAVRHKYLWLLYESLTDSQRQKLLKQADEYLQLLDELIADFK